MERYILRAYAGALAAVGASACNMECADDVEQLFFKAVCGSLIFNARLGVIENALFAGTCGAYVTACVAADAARELTLPERIALIGGHCLKALDLVKAMRIKYLAVLAEQLVIYYMTAALAVFAALEQKLGARCCENIIIRCKMYGLAVLLCAEQLGNEMLHLALVEHSVAGDSDNVNIVADYSVLAQQLIEAVRVAGLKKDSGLSLTVTELYGIFRHISTAEAVINKLGKLILGGKYGGSDIVAELAALPCEYARDSTVAQEGGSLFSDYFLHLRSSNLLFSPSAVTVLTKSFMVSANFAPSAADTHSTLVLSRSIPR